MGLFNNLKISQNNKVFNYNIECYPTNYQLILTFHADMNLLNKIWEVRNNQLLKDKSLDASSHNLDEVKEFSVIKEFLPYLKTLSKSSYKKVEKEVKKDGIILLSTNLDKAIYKLNEDKGWDITLTFTGLYSRSITAP